jgi:hypothetical protein
VLVGDLVDLRPLQGVAADELVEETFTRHDYAISRLYDNARVFVDVALTDRFGQRLHALGDILIATIRESGFSPGFNDWHYLYLANPNPSAPPATATGRGVLVLSSTAPDAQGSRVPSAALSLPAPWGGTTTRATCIGALWGYAVEIYATQSCVRGRLSGAIGGTTQDDGILPSPWNIFPRNARRVDFIAKWDVPGSTQSRTVRLWSPSAVASADAAFYADGEIRTADYVSQLILPNLYVRGVDYADIRLELLGAEAPMVNATEYLGLYGCEL